MAAAQLAACADKYRRPRTTAVPSAYQVPLGHQSSVASADASSTAAPVGVALRLEGVSGDCGMAATYEVTATCRSPAIAAAAVCFRSDDGVRPNGLVWAAGCPAELRRSDVSGVCLNCDTGRPPGQLIFFFILSALGYGFTRRRVKPNARQGLRPQAVILPPKIGGHGDPRP